MARQVSVADSLPRYTRDPETSSIRSAAPSYTSAAPSYHSAVPRNVRRLSSAHFAPGFTSRSLNPDIRDLEAHNYNISHWSSVSSGHQARHYHSVAMRRATIASAQNQQAALLNAAAETVAKIPAPGPSSPSEGLDPLEDPYVVGTKMAEQARRERLRRIGNGHGMEILRQEDRNWDFMLSQMADWKEREKSWDQFRKSLDNKKGFFRKRMGMTGN
jgi:hypothetical protein